MKEHKMIKPLLAAVAIVITVSLFIHDYLYDDGPGDPFLFALIFGLICSGFIFLVLYSLYVLGEMIFRAARQNADPMRLYGKFKVQKRVKKQD